MSSVPQSSEVLDDTPTVGECCGGESHCSGESPVGNALAAMPPREGCPPPLQWQQVLAAFREHSTAWHTETPAGRISGRVWGEGPTLVMLNGLGGSHELFALCVFLLKANCRCVLLDYPVGRRVTWPRLTDSIAEVVTEFAGSEGCHLMGTSFGSALALETALRLGSQVRSLTLHAAFAHLPLTVFERAAAGMLRWMPGRAESLPMWRGLQERLHRLWFPPIDPTRWLFYLENAGQTPVAELARRFGLSHQFDVRLRLNQLSTPTLFLHVEGEGPTQSRCRDELAALLPNARTEFLHTTGLLAFLTHPHRLAKLIREFVCPPIV
ncbi:MAG: alpha/beta fold hydrolase [Planctomycetaceae bacterium]